MKIDINALKEHPLNKEIYGDDDIAQLNDLVQKIKESGWIKPIIIKRNYEILSGNRRWKAAKILGLTEIDAEYFLGDPDKELELLLNENFYREKSMSQKCKEGLLYLEIETKKAEERKKIAGIQNLVHSSVVETFPPLEEAGKVRDIIGEKIGISGKSFDKAVRVLNRIGTEHEDTVKFFFEDALNENIDAASKLAEKPIEFVQEVMQRTEGDAKMLSSTIRELEQEEKKIISRLPAGKFQVIYVDFTVPISDDFSQQYIGDYAENDSVLLLWVLPRGLEEALAVIRKWGFKYRTCMLWNKDFCDEVSGNGEILLISSRGNPPMMFENPNNTGKTEKPKKVRELIEATYTGDKLELLVDGWVFLGKE